MQREINALNLLKHDNIACLHDVVYGHSSTHLLMERGGIQLHSMLLKYKVFNEFNAKIIFRQILAAVAYMHCLNFAHRDLKLSNVLVDRENNVKLVNFGQAIKFLKNQ